MTTLAAFLLIVLSVIGAAWLCHAVFSPRVAAGRTSIGTASAATLAALLITPGLAVLIVVPLLARLLGTSDFMAVYGMGLFFYAAYAVGLACFIVLNRHFRRLAERGAAGRSGDSQ